jgi:hypothetical protein
MKEHNLYAKWDEQIQGVVTKFSTTFRTLNVKNIFKPYTHPNEFGKFLSLLLMFLQKGLLSIQS